MSARAVRRRGVALLVALVAVAALGSTIARADGGAARASDELFERGNQAYLHGDYKGAIDAFEQVLASGVVHEDLYYALGNAYLKAGRLGPAILDYERALALDPDQEDAQANLKLARDAASERFQDRLVGGESEPLWLRALSAVTLGGAAVAFVGLYVTLFLLVVGVYFAPRGPGRVAAVALLVFTIVGAVGSGGLLAGRYWLATRAELGVVLPDELAVKEGPDAGYQTSFLVHAGLRVRAVAHDQDWIKVRLGNGLEGWVRSRDVGRL